MVWQDYSYKKGGIFIPEIKFDPELEKLVKEKKEEIEQKILSTGKKYPLSIEDFAALAWEMLENKYPERIKAIDEFEVIEILMFEVSELYFKNKLVEYLWIPTGDGGFVPLYKTAENITIG